MGLSDHIAEVVKDKFASITDNLTSPHARRKVLAGIVQMKGIKKETSEVICVSTGTKCISGEHISMNGMALNDCHAEIISRRCLRNYFYDELEKHLNAETAESSIFEATEKGFKLRPDVQFHLFISTSPCGDGRIFSPHEKKQDEEDVDKHPNRKARGQLRTKIESGEGTIPIRESVIQTWDGVLNGERLLTMSCSDKLAKWNVTGVQGQNYGFIC